jgi:hypothetical protein
VKKVIFAIALAAILLLPGVCRADNFLQGLIDFVGSPDGSSMMFLHARSAQAIGPALNFNLHKALWLDLGLLTRNTEVSIRVVPGLSVGGKIKSASGNDVVVMLVNSGLRVCVGAAWTPDPYGGTRIGKWEFRNVGLYGMLGKTF